jgi:hypothetical protein
MGNERNSAPRMSDTHQVRPLLKAVIAVTWSISHASPARLTFRWEQKGGCRPGPPRKRFGREEPAASQL